MLSNDVLDIIRTLLSERLPKALSTFFALSREAVNVFAVDLWGLLAVADEVDDWMMSLLEVSVVFYRKQEMGDAVPFSRLGVRNVAELSDVCVARGIAQGG
jgi:hypothetical protein